MINGIGGVLDIVHTKDTQTEGKYFLLVGKPKFIQTEVAIRSVFNTLAKVTKNCAPGIKAIENVTKSPSVKSGYPAGCKFYLVAKSLHTLIAGTHSKPNSWK